jgi:hypothetical protein
MFSAIACALSPQLAAISAAIYALGDGGAVSSASATAACHRALFGTGSVVELIEYILSNYRPVIADHIHGIAKVVVKHDQVSRTLARWREHLTAGTVPSHLRASAPKVQLTSELANSEGAHTQQDVLQAMFVGWQKASLEASIRLKSDEVKALEAELEPELLCTKLRGLVAAHAPSILARSKLPIIRAGAGGSEEITGWAKSDAAKAICDQVMKDCIVYATRAKALTLATLTFKALNIQKKQQLTTAARTAAGEMDVDGESAPAASTSAGRTEGWASAPSSSVQSMVDKAVAAALKKHNQNAAGAKRKRDDAGAAGPSQPAAKKPLVATTVITILRANACSQCV